MIRSTFLTAALAAMLAAPLAAQSGAPLKTLPHGRYQCSLPGDASGPAWRDIDGMRFAIRNASGYRSPTGIGTYLMQGDVLVFTRGPLKDQRYKRMGASILRKMEADGSLSRIRCVRIGPLQ